MLRVRVQKDFAGWQERMAEHLRATTTPTTTTTTTTTPERPGRMPSSLSRTLPASTTPSGHRNVEAMQPLRRSLTSLSGSFPTYSTRKRHSATSGDPTADRSLAGEDTSTKTSTAARVPVLAPKDAWTSDYTRKRAPTMKVTPAILGKMKAWAQSHKQKRKPSTGAIGGDGNEDDDVQGGTGVTTPSPLRRSSNTLAQSTGSFRRSHSNLSDALSRLPLGGSGSLDIFGPNPAGISPSSRVARQLWARAEQGEASVIKTPGPLNRLAPIQNSVGKSISGFRQLRRSSTFSGTAFTPTPSTETQSRYVTDPQSSPLQSKSAPIKRVAGRMRRQPALQPLGSFSQLPGIHLDLTPARGSIKERHHAKLHGEESAHSENATDLDDSVHTSQPLRKSPPLTQLLQMDTPPSTPRSLKEDCDTRSSVTPSTASDDRRLEPDEMISRNEHLFPQRGYAHEDSNSMPSPSRDEGESSIDNLITCDDWQATPMSPPAHLSGLTGEEQLKQQQQQMKQMATESHKDQQQWMQDYAANKGGLGDRNDQVHHAVRAVKGSRVMAENSSDASPADQLPLQTDPRSTPLQGDPLPDIPIEHENLTHAQESRLVSLLKPIQ